MKRTFKDSEKALIARALRDQGLEVIEWSRKGWDFVELLARSTTGTERKLALRVRICHQEHDPDGSFKFASQEEYVVGRAEAAAEGADLALMVLWYKDPASASADVIIVLARDMTISQKGRRRVPTDGNGKVIPTHSRQKYAEG